MGDAFAQAKNIPSFDTLYRIKRIGLYGDTVQTRGNLIRTIRTKQLTIFHS